MVCTRGPNFPPARPIVAGHDGRIVKTTGDGLLLEFPSVVVAVECAIAIQRLMGERNAGTAEEKRILYRIGVNLGDVLIEGDDIVGDGVNIAARLEGVCEPGRVFISGAAYDHVRGRIDASFVDLGEKDLKNIARPVRVYAIRADAEIAPSSSAPTRPEPPRLSIVVLPFANLSGDPEQDYFVDGVSESLTTDLSRIGGSFVIARNTAFDYKGRRGDVKEIGRELNVRYVHAGMPTSGRHKSIGKIKQPQPMWGHPVPARWNFVVRKNIPVASTIEPIPRIRYFLVTHQVGNLVVHKHKRGNVELDRSDSPRSEQERFRCGYHGISEPHVLDPMLRHLHKNNSWPV